MKLYFFLSTLISTIIISILFSSIKSQQTSQIEMKQLFNNTLDRYNKTELHYKDISEKMKNIKFNIFLKIRYKKLVKEHNKIERNIGKIEEKLNSNNYDKNEMLEDIKELNISLKTYEHKCHKVIHVFNQNEKTKNIFMNMLKAFFITLLIIIIIVLIIIGIVSLYIIKRQRKYYILEEENSFDKIVGAEKKNNEFNQIKIKNENSNEITTEISSERQMKKKKGKKKTKKSNESEIESKTEPNIETNIETNIEPKIEIKTETDSKE